MTPAQRSIIDRAIADPGSFGTTPNLCDAIQAQRDALETAEARVAVLEEAVSKWETIAEHYGDKTFHPGMDHHAQ